jgi:hypothetical protein
MSEENTAGASYLAALKQMTTSAAAAAAAQARANSAADVHISERRRSPRYPCEGSAHLRDVKTKVATWATFTDISMHGCYVEAMATFRMGTQLTLTIELKGYRIECGAEVRVVYPGLGMGIAFTTIAEENRERLRELLLSLSQRALIMGAEAPAEPIPTHTPQSSSTIQNPAAALRAISDFFQERYMLSRDEFLRIVKKSQ